MKVLVTGGCGYIGSYLIPHLLADGHEVSCVDNELFGRGHVPKDNGHFTLNPDKLEPMDAVIHLASLSCDAMCQKDPERASKTNLEGFAPFVRLCKALGCKRFIYASSVAAYGSATDATEDMPLAPSTIYGKGKAACEAILPYYEGDGFDYTIVRSASVCGPSENMRFDLTVNRLGRDAVLGQRMHVNGGLQKRCHIHMKDLCDFYKMLLRVDAHMIACQAFNVVAENASVMDTAMLVARTLKNESRIEVGPSTDGRSYTVSGKKAQVLLGFTPKWRVENAIIDMNARFASGSWKDAMTNPRYMRMLP